MRKKKVTAIVEASSTGFGIYSDDLPGITGYGDTIDAAKLDIKTAISSVLEHHRKKGTAPQRFLNNGHLTWEYKYDFDSLFNYFPLDITHFAKRIGLNDSLLRQYKTGAAKASERQRKKIEAGLHELGRELQSVRL